MNVKKLNGLKKGHCFLAQRGGVPLKILYCIIIWMGSSIIGHRLWYWQLESEKSGRKQRRSRTSVVICVSKEIIWDIFQDIDVFYK